MLTLEQFETLRLNDLFPDSDTYVPTDAMFDHEYLGGQYETLEVPGVVFGYAERTPEKLAYVEVMLLSEISADVDVETIEQNCVIVAKALDLPLVPGKPIGDAARWLRHLIPSDNADGGNMFEISTGPFQINFSIDEKNLVRIAEVLNRDAVDKNCIDDQLSEQPEDPTDSWDDSVHEHFTREDSIPCPECGKPLRTAKARQCFQCGANWH